MSQVLIYTQANCKLSDKARNVIGSAVGSSLKCIEKDITYDVLLKREMIERTGGRASTPQVFINGKHVSNYEDLASALKQGSGN